MRLVNACGTNVTFYLLRAAMSAVPDVFFATCHPAQLCALEQLLLTTDMPKTTSVYADLKAIMLCGIPFLRDETLPMSAIHFYTLKDRHAVAVNLTGLAIPVGFSDAI